MLRIIQDLYLRKENPMSQHFSRLCYNFFKASNNLLVLKKMPFKNIKYKYDTIDYKYI